MLTMHKMFIASKSSQRHLCENVTHHSKMKTNKETYINYLRDLVYLIKERRQELKSNNNKDDFNLGIEMGYREIVEIIQNQASAFQIELGEFGFNDYEKYQKKMNKKI